MLPRRRIVGGDSEKTPLLESNLDTYDKLDKKGVKVTNSYSNNSAHSFFTTNKQLGDSDYIFAFLEEPVIEYVMAARDRTAEFAATVRSLQGRTMARPMVRDDKKAAVIETYSQFMAMAKVISKNITGTFAKLEKLAMCKYLKP